MKTNQFFNFLLLSICLSLSLLNSIQNLSEKTNFIQNNKQIEYNDKNRHDQLKTSRCDLIWDYTHGRLLESCAISADGEYIIAGASGLLYFFNRSSSQPMWKYFAGNDLKVSISSDGYYIAVGDTKGKVYLFNKTSPKPMWSFDIGYYNHICDIEISDDGNYIVVGSNWGYIYLFNKINPQPMWSYYTYESVISVAISSDGFYLIAGTAQDGDTYLFNRTSPKPMWIFYLTTDWADAWSVAMSSSGDYIALGMGDKNYRVYLFRKSSPNPIWSSKMNHVVSDIQITPDGQYIIAGCDKIVLFHRSSPNPIWTFQTIDLVFSVDISSDTTYIAAGDEEGYLYYFKNNDLLFQYKLGNVPGYSTPVNDVDLSDNGIYLVVGVWSDTMYLYNDVYTPGSFTLNSNAETPTDLDGKFDLIWSASDLAQNYSIYTSNASFSNINENVSLIVKDLAANTYPITLNKSGTHYYRVFAFNDLGNKSSNCISVKVQLSSTSSSPDDGGNDGRSISYSYTGSISGYEILTLVIITISIIVFISNYLIKRTYLFNNSK